MKSKFLFSLKFLSETSISGRVQRDIMLKVFWSSCKVLGISVPLCPDLNILDRFCHSAGHNISRKSSGSRVVPCRRPDGQTLGEANSHLSQLCEQA